VTSAISVCDVSKRFQLDHERFTSLKEKVVHFRRKSHEDFWALRDIDAEIETGTTVGLIGHNGSGKSTLLKCIAGILRPTAGEITTRGRVAALLELGAGFQPELTGRENIFLNGTILGMSKREIAKRFDEIVDFAEIEQFIDTQVRFYSSGMYVRLGFAVAVNVEPDILLVDEVLAVGDEAFQRKCLDRVGDLQRAGRTIVVVSHSPDLVRMTCQSAIVLDHGRLVTFAEPDEAIQTFRDHLLGKRTPDPNATETDGSRAKILATDVVIANAGSDDQRDIDPDRPVEIRIGFETSEPVDDVGFVLLIQDNEGHVLHATSTTSLKHGFECLDGKGEVVFTAERLPLLNGRYPVTVGVTSRDGSVVYDWHDQRYHIAVSTHSAAHGFVDIPMSVKTVVSERAPIT
jgi:ABC-2 type transport system ATP-binding protein